MNKPPIQSSTSSVISSYRRRRQRRNPNIVVIIAGLLILGGVILLIVWLTGPSKPLNSLFATKTPTPTMTFTPTVTFTPTETSTITLTPTETATATPSSPFPYTVQEGDSLAIIVEKFNLGKDGIKLILLLNPFSQAARTGIDPTTQIVYPGQQITLPYPGEPLPTSTPIPAGLPRGTKIDYTIEPGDTLAAIAAKFNSTTDDIIKENNITDPNAIQAGQLISVPVNMVTPTATRPPTSTPAASATPSATSTP